MMILESSKIRDWCLALKLCVAAYGFEIVDSNPPVVHLHDFFGHHHTFWLRQGCERQAAMQTRADTEPTELMKASKKHVWANHLRYVEFSQIFCVK